jgi:hypothetical protein
MRQPAGGRAALDEQVGRGSALDAAAGELQ